MFMTKWDLSNSKNTQSRGKSGIRILHKIQILHFRSGQLVQCSIFSDDGPKWEPGYLWGLAQVLHDGCTISWVRKVYYLSNWGMSWPHRLGWCCPWEWKLKVLGGWGFDSNGFNFSCKGNRGSRIYHTVARMKTEVGECSQKTEEGFLLSFL